MEQQISFGDWVRRRRKALDLTQELLAQQVGCALATIKKIEADERRPSREMAEHLADCLRLPVEQRDVFLRAARHLLAVDELANPAVPLPFPTPAPATTPGPALSGTLTFLFTDIAGSSRLWEQHPNTMAAALARHDAILRQAIASHGGGVFKTVGDAFYATFADPREALAAALEAQRALAAEMWGATGPLLVRVALHSGIAEARDGDYFGPALNRVARLLSLGHGGQVLLAASTAELLRDRLPSATALRDLGEHRFKDLLRPERVFQLDTSDLPVTFPPLRGGLEHPHNLPTPPNPLIGREVELGAIQALLGRDEVRLLTLFGPGGTGKTRLALHVAREQLDAFPDGVWFVDLTPIRDPALVLPMIARILGLRQSGNQPLADQLRAYLHERKLLLVLDNLEQVVDAAPELALLLAAAGQLRMLATSREALRLRNEHLYAVPPLVAPTEGLADPLSTPAAQLFLARARAARADWIVDGNGAVAIGAICRRLDGLPLAIELAAARARLLPPQAILERLAHPLDLLTSGSRDLPTRQQTLRATIGWSYELLGEAEQLLFCRLGMCVGGWDLAAAEAVGQEAQTLDLLAGLIDKSLVREVAGPAGQARFTMLETIREYALERLEASGEAEAVGERHGAYFLQLAEQARPEEWSPQQKAWLERLELEHNNLRATLEWMHTHNDSNRLAQMNAALCWFWWNYAHYEEATGRIAQILAQRTELPPLQQARLLFECSWFFPQSAERIAAVTKSLALYRTLGDAHGTAWALSRLGGFCYFNGDAAAARGPIEECLALARPLGDQVLLVDVLSSLGNILLADGELVGAQAVLEECLVLYRAIGDPQGISGAMFAFGELARLQGDYAGAEVYYAESVALRRLLGDRRGMAAQILNVGNMALLQGDLPRAIAQHQQSLQIFHEIGWTQGIGWSIELLAEDATALGQCERAAHLLGAEEQIRVSIGYQIWPTARADYERTVATARAALGDQVFTAAWAAGRGLTLKQAVELAFEA